MPPANPGTRSAADNTLLVKAEAARLGFDLVGVTTPDPPPHLATYRDWLAVGHHGEMAYLASERAQVRRANPRLILPECRSILVLGTHYSPATPIVPSPAGQPAGAVLPTAQTLLARRTDGNIASYAWGEDYHQVLEERLSALADFCQTLAGKPFACRWYTDTGPLLERDLAQRAGLGWIGKNTCLINPRAGSYFFLSELLLSLELQPDPAFTPDHCGSCQRCIEACPTGCILPDRTLDARRCISYLTIEQKGPLPSDLRPHIGQWVFGCDICQQVCPWNVRFARPITQEVFLPPADVAGAHLPFGINLVETLSLSPEAFNHRFRKSPLRRTKRRGLLRNAAVALANTLTHSSSNRPTGVQSPPGAHDALIAALHDLEPLVRGHAAWALGKLGGHTARPALQAALGTESDAWVRAEIQDALNRLTLLPAPSPTL
jgi:epoxyqueuosine reductase